MRPNPEERLTPFTGSVRAWNNLGGSSATIQTQTYYRRWGGSNSPNFPRALVYNYHDSAVSRKDEGSFTSYRNFPGTQYWDQFTFSRVGPYGSLPTPSTRGYTWGDAQHLPDVSTRSIESAMDQIQDRKSNLAQVIAEREQAARSISEIATRLARTVTSLRHGNFHQAVKLLGVSRNPKTFTKNIAQDWLSLQYGWKPLLSDVKGIAEHLAQNSVGRPIRVVARASAKGELPAESIFVTATDSNGQPAGKAVVEWAARKTIARTKLEYIVTNDFLRQGAQLGLTDPLTLAWELLPYSFVVDWFLPVGDFFSRLNYDSGLQYVGGCTTVFTKHSAVARGVGSVPYGGTGIATLSGRCSFEAVRVVRNLHSSPPRPRFPAFKDPFSIGHTLNGLALLRTAFR